MGCQKEAAHIKVKSYFSSPHNIWVYAKEVLKAIALYTFSKEEVYINSKREVDTYYNGCSSINDILHVPGPLHIGL